MNAFELHMSDGTPCGLFVCSECRIIHSPNFTAIGKDVKEAAEECCNRKCKECGDKLEKNSGYTVCDKCRKKIEIQKEKERFEKAERVLEKDWNGPVFTESLGYNDGYFEDIDALDQYIEDNVCSFCSNFGDDCDCDHGEGGVITKPEYVWACSKVMMPKMDAWDVCEGCVCDYLPDDCDSGDLNGYDELQAALDKFVEVNQHFWTYAIDYKKAVILKSNNDIIIQPDSRLFNYMEEHFKPNPEVEKDLLQARKDENVKSKR